MAQEQKDDLSFPQRSTEQVKDPNPTTEATQRQAGPWYFKDGENIPFMRAEAVRSIRFSDNTSFVDVELETKLYINRTAQTHDSVMHQFIDGKAESGIMWLRLCFFTEDIIRVQFSTAAEIIDGLEKQPEFPYPEARMLIGKRQTVLTTFDQSEYDWSLSTSTTRLQIRKKPYQLLAFRQGSKIPFWKLRLSDLFTSDVLPTSIARHAGREATFESFQLSPGEAIYGLGERFDSVTRRGRPVDFVNHDAIGTSNPRTYINVPFFWSTAGYGCFVNSYARIEWDIGVNDTGSLGFSTEEKYMDYFVISGGTPKDILQRYTRDLTGTPRLPPIWSFGLWLSRNSYINWTVIDEVLNEANKNKIPVDVVHLDTFWFREDWNPDLIFDPERFPNPESKFAQLRKDGIRASLWQYTFTPARDDNVLYQEGVAGGFFAFGKKLDGSKGDKLFSYPPGTSGWKTDDAVIDYSNPETRKWYGKKISGLIALGASAIKTDFGDCNPPDAYYHSTEGRRFQNTYTLAYNSTIAQAMRSVNEDTVVWSRSGTAGSQRYPIHWGGDSQTSWIGLQGSFFATLSLGMSGFPFFATDCGGFIGKPTPELYTRWSQLSLMASSHFRSHGAGDTNPREPWVFGKVAVESFRKFSDLRYQLLPYLIEQSRQSCNSGVGLIRHLALEFGEDRNTWHIDTQCLLGESFMVVPVLKPMEELGEDMDVYFPQGKWYDYWTKEPLLDSRGQWTKVPTPSLDSMSIWVKEGSAICYAASGRLRTNNEVGRVVKVECYGKLRGTEGKWTISDGQGGMIELASKTDGQWETSEQGIVVHSYP